MADQPLAVQCERFSFAYADKDGHTNRQTIYVSPYFVIVDGLFLDIFKHKLSVKLTDLGEGLSTLNPHTMVVEGCKCQCAWKMTIECRARATKITATEEKESTAAAPTNEKPEMTVSITASRSEILQVLDRLRRWACD